MVETYKGYTIEISQDEYLESPRAWDNFGKIVTVGLRDFNLADEILTSEEISEIEQRNDLIYLPLYLYQHGNILLEFSKTCRFDSARIGLIYVTHKDIIETYGDLNSANIDKAFSLLKSEIKVYNQYLFEGIL